MSGASTPHFPGFFGYLPTADSAARRTAEGTYLCAQYADRCVREYDKEGHILRELPCPYPPFGVVPLGDRRVLVSCERAVLEFDARARRLLELPEDAALTWACELAWPPCTT